MDLKGYFRENQELAIAFSGGVNSSFLLVQAAKYARRMTAYLVKSEFLQEQLLTLAKLLAQQIKVELVVIDLDVFKLKAVIENKGERCYHCKKAILESITSRAKSDGYKVIADGDTLCNADNNSSKAQKLAAKAEFNISSPLADCGYNSFEIKDLSVSEGIIRADSFSYSCLGAKVEQKTRITKKILKEIYKGEEILKNIGFTDFSLVYNNRYAKLQLPKDQMFRVVEIKDRLLEYLSPYYNEIYLDLRGNVTSR